ncbi:MAG TPA: FHA domain-containing protein [Gammaproteobacteria bacterium]
MPKRSSDEFDLDNTDELPILLEPVELEDAVEPLRAPRPDDTAGHTEIFASASDTAAHDAALAELTEQAEQIPALEAQIRVLTEGTRDLEQRLAEKDERLEELRAAVAASRQAPPASVVTEELAAQLAEREVQLAELSLAVERLEEAAAARSAELERLREAAKARDSEAEDPRPTPASGPHSTPAGDDIREAYSTLRSYVAGRRAWWDEMQATNARLAARVSELEREFTANAKRLAAAEAFASKESGRAVQLRAELVAYARRADELERELRLLRAPAEPALVADAAAQQPADAAERVHGTPPASSPVPQQPSARAAPPLVTDAIDTVPPNIEVIAELEAEVEYKRQQVAAQLVELRDREQQLHTATSELRALRSELDDSRSNVAELERTVADKDRALEARDTRIAALHEELKHRVGAAEKRGAGDFSLPTIDSAAARRVSSHDAAVDSASAPALICLTGDAPKRFALLKKTVTVGRGPQCDLQIVTHFVSREHARLTVSNGATLIEDLGSRNGVFVNSVRVDRRHLQQGDLVTIGETQFRFIESMAH